MYETAQLAQLSGTEQYKNIPVGGQYFDSIKLGKYGNFYLEHYSQQKDVREDPTLLGDSFGATILKIRRKLIKWSDKVKVLESVEYDAGAEEIRTTAGTITEKQAKEQGAKVQLVLYALVGSDVAKITVTGGSLYNPDDDTDLRLYSYLQTFEGDDHVFTCVTTVSSKQHTYTDRDGFERQDYQMTFARNSKIENMDAVGDALTSLAMTLVENDERDARFLGSTGKSNTITTERPAVPSSDENDDPDAIPF